MRNSWWPPLINPSEPWSVSPERCLWRPQTSPCPAGHGQHTSTPPSPSRNSPTELQSNRLVSGASLCTIGICLCCLLLTSFPETCSPLFLWQPLHNPTHPQALLSPKTNPNPNPDPNPNTTQCPGPMLTLPGLLLSCWLLSYQDAPAEIPLCLLETEVCSWSKYLRELPGQLLGKNKMLLKEEQCLLLSFFPPFLKIQS